MTATHPDCTCHGDWDGHWTTSQDCPVHKGDHTMITDQAASPEQQALVDTAVTAYLAHLREYPGADIAAVVAGVEAVLADIGTLAAATGLARPADVTRGWADNWAMHYPADVFIPLEPNDIHAVHEAFHAAGLSVDAWTAHIMRHVCLAMRDDADRLARESRAATEGDTHE